MARKRAGAAPRSKLFTVGYEGRSLDDFVALLQQHGIDRVVDVRALPLSRRRGFSKTPLGEALGKVGIDYVHLKIAGNPYRDQRDDIERCLALYRDHLEQSPEVVAAVLDEIAGHRAALLCMEADAVGCHRSIIASALPELEIVNL